MRLSWIALSAVGLVGVIFVAGRVFAPDPAVLPPLFAEMPTDHDAANEAFQARIGVRYPLPMKIGEFLENLSADGFVLNENKNMASFVRSGLVCATEWRLWWTEAAAEITEVVTSYGKTCL